MNLLNKKKVAKFVWDGQKKIEPKNLKTVYPTAEAAN